MQVISSSAIGVVGPRAAVRQRSRRDLRRIMQFGQRPVIPLAISWVYGRRCLILAATPRPLGLLLIQPLSEIHSFSVIAFPVIVPLVIRRHKNLCWRLVEPQAPMALTSIRIALVVAASQRSKSTFLRDAGEGAWWLRRLAWEVQ